MFQEVKAARDSLADGQFNIGDVTSVGGVGMSALSAFLDPAGALVGAALGPLLDWVVNNVDFLKRPLDALLGDPEAINQHSHQWNIAAQQLGDAAQQQFDDVKANLQQWTGPAYDAFIRVQVELNGALVNAATMCQTMGKAVVAAGVVVAVLRELIWGLVKETVISLVTQAVIAAAAAIPSLGSAIAAYTAWAAAKVGAVVGKIAEGISKVFAKLSKLTSNIGPLSRAFDKAADAFARLAVKFGVMPAPGSGPSRRPDDSHGPVTAPCPPFGEPQPLLNPGERISAEDYPFLQTANTQTEPCALPGKAPKQITKPVDVPEGWSDPTKELPNFRGEPKPEKWPAGETRYRVVGNDQYPNGGYWTTRPPGSDRELRADLAVRNDWNGNHGLVSYTPSEDIPVWTGRAAPQNATFPEGVEATQYLPGGGQQIWLDYKQIPEADLKNPNLWRIQSTPWSD